jgi:hypothetical protein
MEQTPERRRLDVEARGFPKPVQSVEPVHRGKGHSMDYSNRLRDIDNHSFAVAAFCNACGRSHELELSAFSQDLRIPELRSRVCCDVCGSKDVSVRVDPATPSEGLHGAAPGRRKPR